MPENHDDLCISVSFGGATLSLKLPVTKLVKSSTQPVIDLERPELVLPSQWNPEPPRDE